MCVIKKCATSHFSPIVWKQKNLKKLKQHRATLTANLKKKNPKKLEIEWEIKRRVLDQNKRKFYWDCVLL